MVVQLAGETSLVSIDWSSVLLASRVYCDGFQIVAVSFIAEFSYQFCCFVFDINQLKLCGSLLLRKRTPNKISEDSALF